MRMPCNGWKTDVYTNEKDKQRWQEEEINVNHKSPQGVCFDSREC